MSRDAPIKERSDVLEGVGGFARGFDALMTNPLVPQNQTSVVHVE